MADFKEDLREQLLVLGVDADNQQLNMCRDLCLRRGLDAEEFAEQWVAFSLTGGRLEPNEKNLAAFESKCLDGGSAPDGDAPEAVPDRCGNPDVILDYLTDSKAAELIQEDVLSDRDAITQEIFSTQNTQPTKYSLRSNAGTVVCDFGNPTSIQNAIWNNMSGNRCTIEVLPNESKETLTSKAMYGFEMLHGKASLLDNNIKYLSQYILHKANVKKCVPLKNKSQVPVSVVGRIDCDADGRLNPKSVVLQGTWDDSMGCKVPVDLDQLKQYSLFPGQVVAMTGMNVNGDRFVAQEVYYDGSHVKPAVVTLDASIEGTLHVVLACGPFTTSDSLGYDPLFDYVDYIKQNRPHVAVFVGPFMDANHQSLTDNMLSDTFKVYFEKLTEKIMSAIDIASPNTQVVFVSSARDIFHANIYPTPPFYIRKSYNNLLMVSDPCVLNISGVNIGITATDVLMHLSKEEISFPPQGPDKLGRLASHLILQQSFYPLWPPNAGLSVDTTLWSDFCGMNSTPHLLVVPSDFRYFIKDISGCLVVNPERLTKGVGGGTFLRMQIRSGENTTDNENILCQILRI